MSVLIKGMKIPSNCAVCPCYRWGTDYVCAVTREEPNDFKRRPNWCPLVEVPSHGRLIDADKVIKSCEIWKETEIQDEHDDVWNRGIDACINEIKHHAPTVIESEEEK